jgi:ABC-type dipeptide/oligopeptide/nickel transport systems, permease components
MSIESNAPNVLLTGLSSADATDQSILQRPPRSWLSDAFRRLLANRLAVIGAIYIVLLLLVVTFAPIIAPRGYEAQDYNNLRAAPNAEYWFGTDAAGRDMWARVIYGARVSLMVGILVQIAALAVGVPLGLIAGFFGGRVDSIIMRVVDVLYAFPNLLFAILLMAWLGPGIGNVIIALSLTGWLTLCRLVRAQTLSLRSRDFVVAADAIGAPTWRVLFMHILPNTLSAVITASTFGIPQAILAEATLSFIGVGVSPPVPSWGQMVSDNILYIRSAWHLALFPSLALGLTILAFTLFGDGLRDAFDPKSNH